ncbi:MAG: PAAR domain-containing protein [Nannocystis sp.]|nr:PAAR domain-containing protein [Nannocystis sp.]
MAADAPRAARVGDPFKHSSALVGFAVGAIAAVVVCVVVVGTGGAALVVAAAAVGAVGAGAGWVADNVISEEPVPGMQSGVLEKGTADVLINGRPGIAIFDQGFCFIPIAYEHGHKRVVEGSQTVRFGCRPATRMRDSLICDAKIASGSDNVLIGGPPVRVKGTRRSWFDDVLDYGSVFLTALSCTTWQGCVLVVASSGLSYVMNKYEAPSWLTLGAVKVLQFFSPLGGVLGAMSDASVYSAFSNKYEPYSARKDAQITQYKETGQLPKGLKNPPTKIDPSPYYSHYFVPHNKQMKPPAKLPKNVPLANHAGKLFGAGVVVDVLKLWRDASRDSVLDDLLREGFTCDNDDWLEPA